MNTNNTAAILKPRETWCDIVRGICALSVLMSHIPGFPDQGVMYVTPFTLPGFFILSGYFTKNCGGNIPEFLYSKTLKVIILKLMFCVTTVSLQVIAGLILHPSTIPDWLYNTLVVFLLKPTANFFSILTLCSVYFILINKICRDKPLPMILTGLALSAVGFAVSRERIIRLWCWDTALVCVSFFIFGYCARQSGAISGYRWKPKHAVISGAVFFAMVTAFALVRGVKHTRIIVGNNTFLSPLVSVPLFISGNYFIIALANVLPASSRPIRLLMYIGKHSMLFFMLGGPALAYIHYFHTLLFRATHWSFLQMLPYKVPAYLLLTTAVTLILSLLSDRFCPALNGNFRMKKELIKEYPKTCAAVCASVLIIGAGIIAAAVSGIIIPNRVYARHYEIHGVDVSSYQGSINWKQMEKQNVRFAFIKATEGSSHVDRFFDDNWKAVSETDIIAGAYHFFSFESSGQSQAEHFIATVPVTRNALPPVVDLEYYGDHERHPLPAEKIVPELKTLFDALEEHYGRRPIIYVTEPSYLQYVYSYFDDYDIWFREVKTSPPEGDWRFWQYTNRAKLDGYDGKEQFIDTNVFMGTKEEWEQFLRA